MPGPYRRLDVPNVNQYVVITPAGKAKKKATPVVVEAKAEPAAEEPKPVESTVKKSTAK
jgi:hypothetical protein